MDQQTPAKMGPAAPFTTRKLIKRIRRLAVIVMGFTLLTFGTILGLVPLIPGWPLVLLGLTVLAGEYVWARTLLKRVRGGAVRFRDVIFPRRKKPAPPTV